MAYPLSYPHLPQNMLLEQQLCHHQLFNPWPNNLTKITSYSLFSSRRRSSKPNRMIQNALVQSRFELSVEEKRQKEFFLMQKPEPQEDPRLLREVWREIHGKNDWEGILDPINSHLRQEILRYGEFAQACYDSFDFDPHSMYCGSCKFVTTEFFDKLEMAHYGYNICRYVLKILKKFI